jgi:hypothetical protein
MTDQESSTDEHLAKSLNTPLLAIPFFQQAHDKMMAEEYPFTSRR